MYLLLLIAAVLLASCGDARDEAADRPHVQSVSEDGDTTYAVRPDDPEMRAARERARCTVSEFIRRFHHPPATQTEVKLKGVFRDDEGTEYLWLDVLRVDGDSVFVGTVANDPGRVRSLAYGDTVTIRSGEVADWYAVDRDTLIAGFTTRVLRAKTSGADPAGRDTADGYVIDPDSIAWRRLERFCVPARL
jgi:uncharacterized protein YegJ (DUF2314 family)